MLSYVWLRYLTVDPRYYLMVTLVTFGQSSFGTTSNWLKNLCENLTPDHIIGATVEGKGMMPQRLA